MAANIWSVGDKIGIALDGCVPASASDPISGTYYAFIIGFDHNSTYEGNNTIHFQFGKTAAGTDIAFVDSTYSSSSSSACLHMNSTKTNSGGWESSYMRRTLCSAFLSAMPTAWQNIIASCTKYSDNIGGGSNTASYVTSTSDKIWLLSEYEVYGTRTYANSAEQNYQAQYTYYANGNSSIKYKHSTTTATCMYWLRSVNAGYSSRWCRVRTDGDAGTSSTIADSSTRSCGFAPGFKI